MPELIDLRRRIKSVRNTQQITQAMKTVATAKFKKSQQFVLEGRPFWHESPHLLAKVVFWAKKRGHPLLAVREEKRVEGVVITSDKGLAGAFNSNLLSRAQAFFEEKALGASVNLVLIGKKAVTFFKKLPFSVDRVHTEQVQKLSQEGMKDLAQFLMRLYIFNQTDAVYVVYNEFKSILSPKISIARLLPISSPESQIGEEFPPDWDPGTVPLLEALLPLYVESQIRHFFFESETAEHAARMMAMDNATKNAEELIDDLTLVMNKIRQASITKELLEIMTAVEALAKK
ncbi:MAG: ATP synthase F1 subunit gamma [Candidatus Aminicenantes bacterium]|nr:MAG: ATP synthase F1 subunit gamma [Candidatus Aminicenantes bacterium]